MSLAIVWFRRDLRLTDNPALQAALKAHEQVLPVYIHAPDEEAPWTMGEAQRVWLAASLQSLKAELITRGADLALLTGATLETLLKLISETKASAVYWNRLYEPAVIARDKTIKAALRERQIAAHSYNGALLVEPWEISNLSGKPYRVFTPYWRAASQHGVPQALAAPVKIAGYTRRTTSLAIADIELHSSKDWTNSILQHSQPGESGAQLRLNRFIAKAVNAYPEARDFPANAGISGLSPHLHFGEISPRQIIEQLKNAGVLEHAGGAAFVRQLYWREFAHHLLYHFPETPEAALNRRFSHFPWKTEKTATFHAWCKGRTGIPLVDAGMRELWHTGFVHNRVRMVAASFLVKNLGLHWTLGAHWFWETLLDADLANNTMGWQWVAGTGADAAPYHRIFNPVRQSERFDPEGRYIRRHVPELQAVPNRWIHCPWLAPAAIKREWALSYPDPIVDLDASRKQALAAYDGIKNRETET